MLSVDAATDRDVAIQRHTHANVKPGIVRVVDIDEARCLQIGFVKQRPRIACRDEFRGAGIF